jgi:hypothetical protein
MIKVKPPYKGNAITDGQKSGGWFVRNKQYEGRCAIRSMCLLNIFSIRLEILARNRTRN